MPCFNEFEAAAERKAEAVRCAKIEAMLCHTLQILENFIASEFSEAMSLADLTDVELEKETGITGEDVWVWWTAHKRQDKRRKQAENIAKLKKIRRKELATVAKAKLTDEELKALIEDQVKGIDAE